MRENNIRHMRSYKEEKKFCRFRKMMFVLLIASLIINPAISQAATGVMVGSDSLILNSGENLFYGTMSTSSNSGAGGILLQKPSGTSIFKVGSDGSGFFAGNVGIGVTNPVEKLEVSGNIKIGTDLRLRQGGSNNFVIEHISDSGNLFMRSFEAGDTSGDLYLNDNGGNTILGGSTLYAQYNGNVGISTTAPARKLDVFGTGRFYGATQLTGVELSALPGGLDYGSAIYMTNDLGSNMGAVRMRATYSGVGSAGNPNFAIDRSTTNLPYGSNPSSLTYVNSLSVNGSNGNVGIGLTAPSQKLHVSGAAQLDAVSFGVTPGSTQTLALATVEYVNTKTGGSGGVGTGTSGQTLRHDGTGWVSNSTLYNSGTNVGIGTANPVGRLEVKQNMSVIETSFTSPHLKLTASSAVDDTGFVGITYAASSADNYGWSSGALRSGSGLSSFVWKHHNNSAAGTEHMRITNNGNVGIGTTSPISKLHVYSNSGSDTYITLENAGGAGSGFRFLRNPTGYDNGFKNNAGIFYITTSGDNFASENNRVAVDYNGNVGIGGNITAGTDFTGASMVIKSGNVGVGTTTPTWKLDVADNFRVFNSQAPTYSSYLKSNWSDADSFELGINNHKLITSGNYHFGTELRFWTADTQRMVINSAGNVGIGNTAPTQKLHVGGAAQLDAVSWGVTPGSTQNLALATVEFVKAVGGLWGGTKNANIWNGDAGAGNVGIGITNPAAKLQVVTQYPLALGEDGILKVKSVAGGSCPGCGTEALTLQTTIDGKTDDYVISGYGGDSRHVLSLQPQGGYVGIGTTTPSQKLHVSSGNVKLDNNQWLIWRNAANNADSNIMQLSNANIISFGDGASSVPNGYRFNGASTNWMTINSSGNVGIGTTNPTAKLSVIASADGDGIQIRRDATINGYSSLGFRTNTTEGGNYGEIRSTRTDVGGGGNSNMSFYTYNGGLSEKMRISETGNVGIATTTPIRKLHVAGDAQFDSVSFGVTPGPAQTLALATVEYVNSYQGANTSKWGGTKNGSIWNGDTGTGNVGIGMTAPLAKLHVSGTLSTTVPANGVIIDPKLITSPAGQSQTGLLVAPEFSATNNIEYAYGLKIAPRHTGLGDTYKSFGLFVSAPVLESGTLQHTYAAIFDGGPVGIGTTNPVQTKLVIGNEAAFNTVTPGRGLYGLHFDNQLTADYASGLTWNAGSGTESAQAGIYVQGSGSYGSKMYFGTTDNYTTGVKTRMMITHGGNVGINTTNPTQKLHVNGALQLDSVSFGVTPGETQNLALTTVEYVNSRAVSLWGGTRNGDIWNGDTGSGNVGIGTTTPGAKLHAVNGAGEFKFDDGTGNATPNIGVGNTSASGKFSALVAGTSGAAFFYDQSGTFNIRSAPKSDFTSNSIGANGDTRLHINTSGNIGIGTTTADVKLRVSGGNFKFDTNGTDVLFSSKKGTDSDGYNIFIGGGGQSTVGNVGNTGIGARNTALGIEAMLNITTGYQSTAVGFTALRANTDGYANTALGHAALTANTSGDYNVATGYTSLWQNTTGNYNSAVGGASLRYNTTGSENTAIGTDSLKNVTTGTKNAAIGRYAGAHLADGSTSNQTPTESVYLGYNSRAALNGVSNEIVIGSNAIGMGSNSAVLGNDSIANTYLKGVLHLNQVSFGVTPGSSEALALSTVEYVNNKVLNFNRTAVNDTNYSAVATDYIIGFTALSANRTITLPNSLCTSGRTFVITNETNSAYSVIIDPEGGTTIAGATTKSLAAFNSTPVYCNGTNWFIY